MESPGLAEYREESEGRKSAVSFGVPIMSEVKNGEVI